MALAQTPNARTTTDRWEMASTFGITWDVAHDARLPHEDHLEMSGRLVSYIVRYGVNAQGELTLDRTIVWPTLRTIPNNTHASFLHNYGMETTPAISVNGTPLSPEHPQRMVLDGRLTIESETAQHLDVTRVLFPTTNQMAAMEQWTLRNASQAPMTLTIAPLNHVDYGRGTKGIYVLEVTHDAPAQLTLKPGETYTFGVTFYGRKILDPLPKLDVVHENALRQRFVKHLVSSLRLETPDPVLNRAFDFAKIRAGESIFSTAGGLMHCPGGGSYYAATWCNDQVEYAGPFFPYLGDAGANEASRNAYEMYRKFMGPEYKAIPSSIVAEGTDIWEGAGDRGDAAMYAYGASQFALARGDKKIAEELWPGIVWCLEYCKRQMNAEGVIRSDRDELEGRFPTGSANLSTSSLAYGGLRGAANLARALGKPAEVAQSYDQQADALENAIEHYFGATVEWYNTYRYYDGNTVLRSWICLPLTMGIMTRKAETIDALFSPHMWTPDGLATQEGDTTFWDRSTLYAFRGVLMAGNTQKALTYLRAYSQRRLLGDHVPYAVEAWPEGNQRHLSAESALYARVFTEGLFGIYPTGLHAFRCTPQLPDAWDRMALRSIKAFGQSFDIIVVRRSPEKILVTVRTKDHVVKEAEIPAGGSVQVTF